MTGVSRENVMTFRDVELFGFVSVEVAEEGGKLGRV